MSVLMLTAQATAETAGPHPIQRLFDAIEIHPDDPDLAWALTRRLAGAGRASDAMQHARDFLARWPERRPDARLEIAREFLDAGDTTRALVLLDEEIRVRPRSGVAHFYRGIAYREQGRLVESNHEFAIAADMAPALQSESLLAQALGLFELGQDDDAVDLLKQILEIDPTSESAIRARLMLRQREILSMQRVWRLDAHAGYEWDSNVLLESATNESAGTGRSDSRGVWGAALTIRALTLEKGILTLGYRYDQTQQDDLGRFDLLTNSGFASGSWQLSENILTRLDALAWNTRQSGHNELTAGTLRPNLIFSFGPRWGALRAFAQYEIFEYDALATIDPWERDGYSVGGGLEQFFPLPVDRSFASISVAYQRNHTQSDTSGVANGFDGDYDYGSTRVRARSMLNLPLSIRAGVEAGYAHDRYDNDNFLNFLETFQIKKRRDDTLSGRVEFSREFFPHTEFQVYWRGTWRMSNVSFFDYDQQVVGVVLRVTTD
jgi:tetratricopeptide (TPR) repeat protein